MDAILGLLESGWFTALALAILAAEVGLLAVFSPRVRASPGLLAYNALSGFSLIGALHFALTGASLLLVLACLTVALFAHVGDLLARLK